MTDMNTLVIQRAGRRLAQRGFTLIEIMVVVIIIVVVMIGGLVQIPRRSR